MTQINTETIFALATAPGRAGVAVIRVSGPASATIRDQLTSAPSAPRQAHFAEIRDPEAGRVLDKGLVLWFPAPNSFTGEDVLELHCHGSAAVIEGLYAALGRFESTRLAAPGEFTRRAFDNDKLDLTEVEGLADLIAAETEAQRDQALQQMGGGLSHLYEGWRADLIKALAYFEAEIDFADEDIDQDVLAQRRGLVEKIRGEIVGHLDDNRRGEVLRQGLRVALIGPPNAGKSTLINALSQREVAIVSPTAGTTRDIIEVHLNLGGYPVIVADTAGLRRREEAGDIEVEGMRRALDWAERADLTVLVVESNQWPLSDGELQQKADSSDLILINKIDVQPIAPEGLPGGIFAVSLRDGDGLKGFLQALERRVKDRLSVATRTAMQGPPSLTRARHRQALEACEASLGRALEALQPDLAAEDLRLAARDLAQLTGRVDVEDLLDVIFGDFCIGK